MNVRDSIDQLREQLESQSLYLVLSLLGRPSLLKVLRRSTRYREQLKAMITEHLEALARHQSLATETELARVEVELYEVQSRLCELWSILEESKAD